MKMNKQLILGGLALILIIGYFGFIKKSDKNTLIQPARATWNTGYFQEVLVRKGLEALGYKVAKPKELQNNIFYQSVTLGDVDYWVNGWFPNHSALSPKEFEANAQPVGYVVKAGGLQGYLVSKKHAEQFNIKSLDDFKRTDVKKAFDQNNDGKADLTACSPGWQCEKVISHHMKVYDLGDHINVNKASYDAGMASTLGHFSAGDPIFFYTWAPNWTIFKLKPGKDVVWINVPETIPTDGQKPGLDRMEVADIEGAVTNPIKLGFVISDIRVVANKKFLAKYPKIKRFMELFTLPLSDINSQNTKLNAGEKSEKDIERHANEWIQKNQTQWDGWIKEATNI